MQRYIRRPVSAPEARRFTSKAVADTGVSGPRPSFQKLLAHLNMEDPEWPCVAGVLREMEAAGVELCETTVTAARKLGERQWFLRSRRIDEKRSQDNLGLAAGSAAIVYYIRRGPLIKIGTTEHPAERFAELLPDEICAFEPGSWAEESRRHLQFQHLRCYREHFAMGDELMTHISMMRSLYGEPDPTWPTIGLAIATPSKRARRAGDVAVSELITATEAERRYGIKRVHIRQLVHRGLLCPAGMEGKAHLFFAGEIARLVAN